MERIGKFGVAGIYLLLSSWTVLAVPVGITYESQQMDLNTWEYTFTVTNYSLAEGVEAFTIWFDYGLYENLFATSGTNITNTWDELVVQPDNFLEDDGYYDALIFEGAVMAGQSRTGFKVMFDWLGQEEPAGQLFEVFDPEDYSQPIASGSTVPEPGTMLLLGLGAMLIRKRRK